MSGFAGIVDRHVAGDSFVHRLDPRTKLALTLAYIFTAILTPQAQWEVFVALGGLLLLVSLAAGFTPWFVIRRSLLALPFVLAALPVLFNRPGETLFEVPLFGWTATEAGLEAVSSIFIRSWLSVMAATILTATTEPDLLLRSLRAFGVPRVFVATISFMWRYIFVIGEEAQRLMTARAARSARPDGKTGGSLRWRAAVAGNMVGSLFLRTLNRSERVYVAMLARGYNGEMRTLNRSAFGARDVAAGTVVIPSLVAILLYAHL